MRVRWSRPAARQLDEIGDYVARDNPVAAHRLVNVLVERAAALATHPHLGRAGRVPETRELVVAGTPYIVVYRVRLGDVEVLAVFHGARRWPDDFQ
jgi:toxin ParE1/3/4